MSASEISGGKNYSISVQFDAPTANVKWLHSRARGIWLDFDFGSTADILICPTLGDGIVLHGADWEWRCVVSGPVMSMSRTDLARTLGIEGGGDDQ